MSGLNLAVSGLDLAMSGSLAKLRHEEVAEFLIVPALTRGRDDVFLVFPS
jgi:hypothetical protein